MQLSFSTLSQTRRSVLARIANRSSAGDALATRALQLRTNEAQNGRKVALGRIEHSFRLVLG